MTKAEPDHRRAIQALLAAVAGEDVGDLRGLVGRLDRRPAGSENIPVMAHVAAVTTGRLEPERMLPMLRGEGGWRHGLETTSAIYGPWIWAAVLWLHVWARREGQLEVELAARRWLRSLVGRLALAAVPEPPRHVTYQVAEREITRAAVDEAASLYAAVPGERSAVPLREEDPRLSNTRIERSELHPLLGGALGRPWGRLGGRQRAFRDGTEPWPLALAQDALKAWRPRLGGGCLDAEPSPDHAWGLTDFDRQILLEHVELPRPVTAEFVAAMITHPQPPGVDVVTWVTGSSVIRWQTRSTSHVKPGHQGLVPLVAYHRPSRRAWWVTPYASGPGLGEPWARATLRDDAKAVRLWVEDPQGGRGAEIEFPLPRFGPPGFVVVESESGAAVLP